MFFFCKNTFILTFILGIFCLKIIYKYLEKFKIKEKKEKKDKKDIFLPTSDKSAIKMIHACNYAQIFTKHNY